MVMWLPSFLAETITPSIMPSWADETVPVIAAPFWACAPAAFRRVAAATADKRAEILLPDIATSLAGKLDRIRAQNTQSQQAAKAGPQAVYFSLNLSPARGHGPGER